MENVIEISNLTKTFGELVAVDNLSFRVKRGEFFAFLGVNGAGKSTTISIMCGQLTKDSGEAKILSLNADKDIREISKDLGVVFQNSVLDKFLSVYDNLSSRASLYGMSKAQANQRIDYLANILEFRDLLKRPVGKLSGGQRRRIDVARALLNNPKILILDEPTTGLDPQTRKTMWSVIDDLRKKDGLTVFLTTHYMEEAADADYVVILNHGRIAAEGTPLELKNKYTGDFLTVYNVEESIVKKLELPYEKIRDAFRISVTDTAMARDIIVKHNELTDFEITKGKMDDVFLSVTGIKLEGGN